MLPVRDVRLHVDGCGVGGSDSGGPRARAAVAVAAAALATITAAAFCCVLEVLFELKVQKHAEDYPRAAIYFVLGDAARQWQ